MIDARFFQTLPPGSGVITTEENPCSLLQFSLVRLEPGQSSQGHTKGNEAVLVVLGGKIRLETEKEDFGVIGERANVFQGSPWSVYLPPGTGYAMTAAEGFPSIAVVEAPAQTGDAPFLIPPNEVETGVWGKKNFTRYYRKILVNTNRKVERLIVGETITPSGNWSSYPPHRHEVDRLPHEVFAEEIYYFKVSPSEGFGLTYHYTDDRQIDRAYPVTDDSILYIPKGYHTVASAPGYTTYYLWALAGNHRTQAVSDDPAVGWVKKAEALLD